MPQTPPTQKPLQIFKPGRHTAMGGQALNFSESDLQATVAAYDPTLHEAPLVVGHPAHDLPAFGWVSSLSFSEGGIDATPAQVNPDFADMVAAGAFKKISASFYAPGSPSNPVPDVYYLRHVGFLGAQPPAVKGLRNASFADLEEGVLTFSEWDDVDNAGLWRNLREWFIGKFGQAEADAVLPGDQVKSLEQGAQDELREAAATDPANPATGNAGAMPTQQFSENNPTKESTVTEEEAALLRTQSAAQSARIAELEKIQAVVTLARVHADNTAFCEGLATDGARVQPAFTGVLVAALDHFDTQPRPVEFGEGEETVSLADGLRTFLKALPKQVAFGEFATGARAGASHQAGTLEFAAPEGFGVDALAMVTHSKALAHQKAHGGGYVDAVKVVS